MGYVGAKVLRNLKQKQGMFASLKRDKESSPHDVIEVKNSDFPRS